MTDEDMGCSPAVIIYDGMCHLCSGSMAWLAHRVPKDRLKFTPVQSAEGAKALRSAGLNELDPSSFLLLSGGRVLQKSKAVIATLRLAGGPWKVPARALNLLPLSFADRLYDWVAKNRYKWFGRRDTCFIARQSRSR
jgi:predicted DCC family thiol-disulfide oxidoreductase YuxK